ncbi:MAG: glycosyltransferase, partial [Ignisphaera sp.]
VVHHGVNLDAVNSITVDKQSVKKQLKARVLFGTVASELPRKGLDRLAKAISLASPKTPDAKFVILTTARGATHFRGLSNTYVRVEFGKLDRSSILGLIASFDYYVCSSLAEGFGLPLLEAQAFGVPCIYPEYQPLTEVAHPAANFTVGVSGEGYEDHGQGILYLMHYYSVEELAQRIVEAYEICICDPDEYNERSRQVREHAKQFDAVKTYSWFVR